MSPHRQLVDAFLRRQTWRCPLGGSWLDVGGARQRGRWRRGTTWTVVDRVDAPGVAVVADMRSIPLPDGIASIVKCTETLYFLTDPRPALREFRRLLMPDGLLVVTVPWMRGTLEPGGDRARYTAAFWTDACFIAGFTDVRVEALGGKGALVCQMLYEALAGVWGRGLLCRTLARCAPGADPHWTLGWGIVAR